MPRVVPQPAQTAKLATQVQNAPFGTQNNAGRRRPLPQPIVLQPGLEQGLEQGGRQFNRMQQSIQQATSQVKSLPFAQGNLLQNLTLMNGPNYLPHGLPQAWRGAMLCTIGTAGITWWIGNTKGYPAAQYITLNVLVPPGPTQPCTADLWVW